MFRPRFVMKSQTAMFLDYRLLSLLLAATFTLPVAGCEQDSRRDDSGDSLTRETGTGDTKDVQEPKSESKLADEVPDSELYQYSQDRRRMVASQLRGRDITNTRVLDAMAKISRERFVPESMRRWSYRDGPLPIGHGQTISQPYIVALMTQLADPQPDERALDVGTGSGYQAAVLAELVDSVFSIEILEPLAADARTRLRKLGYSNVTVRTGDGYRGWPEQAPFDVIIVAAAPDHVPKPLINQLAPGGKLVIPVGQYYQELIVIEKDTDGGIRRRSVVPVAFVPMTGEARKRRQSQQTPN